MELIALTGGVGSGKSTVAQMLKDLGAVVIDADEAARAVVEPGTPGFQQVVEAFGERYVKDGRLDRAALAELVFNDPEALRRLNEITHPLVRQWMAERQQEAADRGEPRVVLDIPLLFESNLQDAFPTIILVWAPPDVQVRRLIEGRGFTEPDARARVAAQLPIDAKRERASHVIDNSGSPEDTGRQVEQAWREITAASGPAPAET
ncbi:MAG TPA: dephospho-CoA kinase [Candidatus Dormibacteraeota bacterium]